MDLRKVVALTLLDLFTAFDTFDHAILHNCLNDWFGVNGSVLTWIESYLNNRKQKIKIEDFFENFLRLSNSLLVSPKVQF